MGLPAWVWFAVAVVAALLGVGVLLRDRARVTARTRARRAWAATRGWQFADVDEVLPAQWRAGGIGFEGGGVARNVVAGSTFTADGRRRVYVFDLEAGGRIGSTVVAVQCRRTAPAVVELWLPSVPFQREQMPELLGPVGQRYAFVSDMAAARGMIDPELVDAVDFIGGDVTVAWFEAGWVLASAPPNSSPIRLERLLRAVGELADVIDPFDAEMDPIGEPEHPGDRHDQQD